MKGRIYLENDVESIVLTDEEGKETEFNVVTKFDIEDKEYVCNSCRREANEAIALKIERMKKIMTY